MKKHGFSHGAAVLVSVVASSLLVGIMREHLPKVNRLLEKFSDSISQVIFNIFGHRFSTTDINTVMLAILLAVIWGMAFALIHKD